MMTLSGTLVNGHGGVVYAPLVFVPVTAETSTESTSVGAAQWQVLTDPDDGSFSTLIAKGTYDVIIKTSPQETRVSITIPLESGTISFPEAIAGSTTLESLVLVDTETGTHYAVTVADGQVTLTETTDEGESSFELTDTVTGSTVTLTISDGQLQITT